jgi:hypothetical protein
VGHLSSQTGQHGQDAFMLSGLGQLTSSTATLEDMTSEMWGWLRQESLKNGLSSNCMQGADGEGPPSRELKRWKCNN